tara:strand:+ start:973 stop:1470 length:498 start_codon:yes stop_codon:yes gene_type:complete
LQFKLNFTLIAAVSLNKVIGSNGSIPWHIPEDLKYFQSNTLYSTVIMGRNTYESIGKPLPNRKNIVITSLKKKFQGIEICSNIKDLIESLKNSEDEIFIIGGEKIYSEFMPLANKMLITEVKIEIEGDSFFPEWDPNEWTETHRSKERTNDKSINYSFVVLERRY